MLRQLAVLYVAVLFAACSSGGDLITHGDPIGPNDPTPEQPTPTDGTPDPTPEPEENHPPVAVADTFRLARGETLVITSLLGNDSDEDGDPLVAYPAGPDSVAAGPSGFFFDSETGHIDESSYNVAGWQDHWPNSGLAEAWKRDGGLTFTAFADAEPGTVVLWYRLIEDRAGSLASASARIVIIIE